MTALLAILGFLKAVLDFINPWSQYWVGKRKNIDVKRPKAWWVNRPRLKNIATVERAQKDKIYPKHSIVIQISATRGQVGLLKSSGKVGSQYAVIYDTIPDSRWLFFYLKTLTPWWFHRVQEGLNIKLEDVENIPLHYF